MRIEWNDRSPSQRPGHHLHRPRVETRRRQMRGGRFNPSGRRPSPDQGGSGYPIPEISAAKTPVSTKGVGKTVVVTAQRSIAMQANSQDGSSGQSSSQQGIAAMAISFDSAEAGCDVAETSTATVRKSASKRCRRARILAMSGICTPKSSRIAVNQLGSQPVTAPWFSSRGHPGEPPCDARDVYHAGFRRRPRRQVQRPRHPLRDPASCCPATRPARLRQGFLRSRRSRSG